MIVSFIVIFGSFLNLAKGSNLDNPCLPISPCQSDERCIMIAKGHHICLNTRSSKTPIQIKKQDQVLESVAVASPIDNSKLQSAIINNMPSGFASNSGIVDFDPCLSSPCGFGKICKAVRQSATGFVCVPELASSQEITDARKIYTNMELLSKDAVRLNTDTILNRAKTPASPALIQQQAMNQNEAMRNLKAQMKLTCLNNPCKENEKCVSRPDTPKGFECIREQVTVVRNDNNAISNLLNDNEFMSSTAKRCLKSHGTLHQRLDIPDVPTHFISCLDHSDFTIQSCPEPLLFNKHLDRCDMDQDPILTGCASSPCKFGARCQELPNLDYQCECDEGYVGKNCEQAPDVCATMPCGPSDDNGNVCHAQQVEDAGLAYYCTCHNQKAFGLSCDEGRMERNPCQENDVRGRVFSTQISQTVFASCDDEDHLSLKVCSKKMQKLGMCKWLSRLSTAGPDLIRDRRFARRHSAHGHLRH